MDDFNDNTSTGWSKTAGFVASNTMMVDSNTDATVDTILKDDFTDDDHEIRFSYRRTSNNYGDRVSVYARFADWDNYIRVEFFANGTCRVLEKVNGTATIIATGSAASTTNTWYDVRIVCDDTSVKAYHKTGENLESLVLSATSAVTTSSKIGIVTWSNTTADLDNIWLIGDSLSNTTTFAVNNANELTTMTDPNGTTTFAFDAWGRMTSKTRGSYAAKYGYVCNSLLANFESTFSDNNDISYEYRGDLRRASVSINEEKQVHRWDSAWRVLSSEDETGSLFGTYIGSSAAYVAGSEASSGATYYFIRDILGSVQSVGSSTAALTAVKRYSPFGSISDAFGNEFELTFTGHPLEEGTGLYYAPYRNLSPEISRWMVPDPLHFADGLNKYTYVRTRPTRLTDRLGLLGADECALWLCDDGFHAWMIIDWNGDGRGAAYGYYPASNGPKGCFNNCGLGASVWTNGEVRREDATHSNVAAARRARYTCTAKITTKQNCKDALNYWLELARDPGTYNVVWNSCRSNANNSMMYHGSDSPFRGVLPVQNGGCPQVPAIPPDWSGTKK